MPSEAYDIVMSQSERDAVDIFWLLFPMLSPDQRESKTAQKAVALFEKYRAFSHDPTKLTGYDTVLKIVKDQLNAELALDRDNHAAVQASREEAYRAIVRMLQMDYVLPDFKLIEGRLVPAATPVAQKSPAKKSRPRGIKHDPDAPS